MSVSKIASKSANTYPQIILEEDLQYKIIQINNGDLEYILIDNDGNTYEVTLEQYMNADVPVLGCGE